MILTLTANPSMDRTVSLDVPLVRGSVHRSALTTTEPGGKGVNVARVVTSAGRTATAVLPCSGSDPLLSALGTLGVRYHAVPTSGVARTNLTISESDGTTTKINEPGAGLAPETVDALMASVLELAQRADWVVLSGSIPPGIDATWYGRLVTALHEVSAKVAVDTSDDPLSALAAGFPATAPDLIKPNAEELAHLTGHDGAMLEASAAQGDPYPTVEAARILVDRGVAAVLATLGGSGAVLVTATGSWFATPPPITPRSTVGAGDSSLAGYILADLDGEDGAGRLARAVAYGSAAAALPGTRLPTPSDVDVTAVPVHTLDSSPAVPQS
ncbi:MULTISPECIES: 1-phosphofructokinase family hexose kinase [unclassified Rhodococcus (in: high G+C Gram-positive bacteria)]|uniref:1-phosphofructokinase family hexose kinase n=1 Tax=unclassified Rhodococcus (in: high G+C Gram-positive bacteria) TaxID=192944 RepID=UPI0006F85F91|nr:MULTISPECIES: 1-phosphofructokinase family hexose kinase [unclassified Rhodococcus (in: high G+C Gram-positive bacteria)]KQU34734.1 1-phosphofructokinase [Rhodococcus sp. Leaf225]KQU45496.1 1-phosphofructokinase [Rhodococcus sp. Leaf258]